MSEGFQAQQFIAEARAKAEAAKREREEELLANREAERVQLLDMITEGAGQGKSEMNIRLKHWKPEEVEELFEGYVKCEKVRGQKHLIRW